MSIEKETVVCKKCGYEFLYHNTDPCPKCGNKLKTIKIELEADPLVLSAELTTQQEKKNHIHLSKEYVL